MQHFAFFPLFLLIVSNGKGRAFLKSFFCVCVGDPVPAAAVTTSPAGIMDWLRHCIPPAGGLRDGRQDYRRVPENTAGNAIKQTNTNSKVK